MPSAKLHFRDYELDPDDFELSRAGHRLRLERKPMELLILLAEKQGQLVKREEIIEKIWGKDLFFDAENGVNNAIRKIRSALNDDSEQPRFVETAVGMGYRFIAPVERVLEPIGAQVAESGAARPSPAGFRWKLVWIPALILTVLLAFAFALDIAGIRHRIFRPGVPPIHSIAVLPLVNLSGDPAEEYFADGMTEALITDLAQIAALRVISRTSVMQYKGVHKPLREIASELGVDAVLEGSVLRVGDQVRITAQLIHARTDAHLWAQSYERGIRNVLALQSEVARAVAQEINVRLTPQEQARLTLVRPVDPEAHEAYLKGHYFWETRTREGLQKALEYFETAIRIDPNYALGYTGVAATYTVSGSNYYLSPQESYPKARTAARKALELDENLAEAHMIIADVLDTYDWDWLEAEREYNRAIELNPSDATAHHFRAIFLSEMGRHTEAIAEIREARSLDPLSPRINANLGWLLYLARQYDQAIQELRKALELFPGHAVIHSYLAETLLATGLPHQAIAEIQSRLTQEPDSPEANSQLARAYARAGKRQEAKKIIEIMRKAHTPQFLPPARVAVAYAALGDKDQAFAWLEKAYTERSPDMALLQVDPAFDPLRSDLRFQDLVRRVGLPVNTGAVVVPH